MQSWATQELRYVELGDARLSKRLVKMVEDLAGQPEASVPQACGDWAATKGAYRFCDNGKVEPDSILSAHQQSTVDRIRGKDTILVIQDTTDLDFTHHPGTEGLGHLDRPWLQGLKVHSCLAVSTEGVPQGFIYQKTWARDPKTLGKKHKRRQLETNDKESQQWLDTLSASEEVIPEGIDVITIADREADNTTSSLILAEKVLICLSV